MNDLQLFLSNLWAIRDWFVSDLQMISNLQWFVNNCGDLEMICEWFLNDLWWFLSDSWIISSDSQLIHGNSYVICKWFVNNSQMICNNSWWFASVSWLICKWFLSDLWLIHGDWWVIHKFTSNSWIREWFTWFMVIHDWFTSDLQLSHKIFVNDLSWFVINSQLIHSDLQAICDWFAMIHKSVIRNWFVNDLQRFLSALNGTRAHTNMFTLCVRKCQIIC